MPSLLASLCRLFDASGTLHIVAGRGRQDGLGHAILFQKGGPPKARSGQRAEDSRPEKRPHHVGYQEWPCILGCRVILTYYIVIMLAGSCSSSSSLVGYRLTHRDKGRTKYKGKIFFYYS